MSEIYPNLMERVIKREPNAYLCAMYWDTEMFGKSTKKRRELEGKEEQKDYKKMIIDLMKKPPKDFNKNQLRIIKEFKRDMLYMDYSLCGNEIYKSIYECIMVGDPKMRKVRAIMVKVANEIANQTKGV